MPRKPLAGKAWWRIGHWGVRFLPMVAELAAVVALERPASGARRPKAGGVRMEARRAKTRRAFGRGLVHDSRPPYGGTPVEQCLVSPSVYWGITQKRVAIRVNFCNHEPSQMIFARPGKAAPNLSLIHI